MCYVYFLASFLHISKDILYDSNNLVFNSLYQIPTTSFQGHQWVVGCDEYHIVGDNLCHKSQDTILTPSTTGFIVKIVKDKHKVFDILPQCLDILAFSIFIELFDSSSSDDLTLNGSSMRSLIMNSQCFAL